MGGVVAREILPGRGSESPPDQPQRAGRRKETDVDLRSPNGGAYSGATLAVDGADGVGIAQGRLQIPELDRSVKTTRQRTADKRQAKLDLVREQVDRGSLVIRQMTDAERLRYLPRRTHPKRRGTR